MRERFIRFMQGRYGTDQLNKFLLYLALGVMIVNMLIRNPGIHQLLYYLSVVLLIISYVRMLSRDYAKRSRENQKFLTLRARILGKFGRGGRNTAQQPGVKIFKCPSCKQKIRVPSGKGKIEITCPKCKHAFIRRS